MLLGPGQNSMDVFEVYSTYHVSPPQGVERAELEALSEMLCTVKGLGLSERKRLSWQSRESR